MKVAVVGAAGQLGQATAEAWSRAGHVVTGLTRAGLDVTSSKAVSRVMAAVQPDVIINCTAYTAVDAAEDDPVTALQVNSLGVLALARAAVAQAAVLVHYSTDFVFDGTATTAYTEDDVPSPQSVYGMSKYLGEQFCTSVPRHYVLRVESLFGGATARSSIDRLAVQLRSGQPVLAFSDRTVSPSFVEDVTAATLALVEGHRPAGLYHCVNSGSTTWVAVAEAVAAVLGQPAALVVPTPAAAVPMRARRPLFAALSNQKLASVGVTMPTWQDAVSRYVGRLVNPHPSAARPS